MKYASEAVTKSELFTPDIITAPPNNEDLGLAEAGAFTAFEPLCKCTEYFYDKLYESFVEGAPS